MKSDVIVKKLKEFIRLMKDCGLIPKVVLYYNVPSNSSCKDILNVTDK